MDFSELFKHTGCLKWSPDGRNLATVVGVRLVVRAGDTLQVVQLWACLDQVHSIEWSPDSKFILCALTKRSTVQVWNMENADWTCTIEEGAAGLSSARWAPDSRHILTCADFQIRLTIWSLVHRSKHAIQMPKFSEAGAVFSHNGRFFAVAERRDCKDYVNVLATENWDLLKRFAVDSSDLVDLTWSPDDSVICVQDSALDYRVLMYSPDGRLLGRYSAYEDALGVKCISWCTSSKHLAVGSYDQKVRIIDHMSWKRLAEIPHPTTVTSTRVAVFKEEEIASSVQSPLGTPTSKYVFTDLPVSVPSSKPNPDKPNPKLGVGLMRWSQDGTYLATRNDNMANAVWIWDAKLMHTCGLLLHLNNVKNFVWSPVEDRLAICCSNGRVYMWTKEGSLCVDVPAVAFQVSNIAWRADGRALLLSDKDRFCLVWPNSSTDGD